MTNIEMLTRLEKVNADMIAAFEKEDVFELAINETRQTLLSVVEYLKDEVTKENSKKQKTTNVLKIAKKIIKSVPDYKEGLKGAWIDNDGNEHYCNCYMGLISYKPLGLNKVENGHDLRKSIPITDSKVKLPTLAEINNQIKEYKAKVKTGIINKHYKPTYKINDELYVNPEYLAWAIEATGAECAEYKSSGIIQSRDEKYTKCLSSAYVITGENAKAIIIPMRGEVSMLEAENYTIV